VRTTITKQVASIGDAIADITLSGSFKVLAVRQSYDHATIETEHYIINLERKGTDNAERVDTVEQEKH
jgi:hypothetical protein